MMLYVVATCFMSQLIEHEGTVTNEAGEHVVYMDSLGNLTVGYGHLVDEDMQLVLGDTIPDEMARELLDKDVETATRDAKEFFSGFDTLSPARQAVLKNMAFNMGKYRLLQFTDTRAALYKSDYGEAAKEMLSSRWAQQVERRAADLAEQMRTGEWQ